MGVIRLAGAPSCVTCVKNAVPFGNVVRVFNFTVASKAKVLWVVLELRNQRQRLALTNGRRARTAARQESNLESF